MPVSTYNTLLVGHGGLQRTDGGDVSVVLARSDSGSLSSGHCDKLQREGSVPNGLTLLISSYAP